MHEISDLQDTIFEAIGVAAFSALRHYDEGRIEDAAAMINEWTTDEGEVLLTHFFDETLGEVKAQMSFTTEEEYGFTYGDYSFQSVD